MELLPDEDERTQLIDRLGRLILAAGAETFVAASIVEPTDRWFPDRWTPDVAGVERLLRRVLGYADLERFDLSIELGSFSTPGGKIDFRGNAGQHEGAAAWFAGIHDDVCVFGVDEQKLEDPASLTGVLAHEVAHAYRHAHDLEDPNPVLEEMLTDLTTVYLGFGVLTTNAAQRYRSGMVSGGSYYARSEAGYLGPQSLAYLLAAQAVVRDEPAIGKRLATNQRACFKAAVKDLGDRDRLIAALGLPLPSLWPARAGAEKKGWLGRLLP